MAVNLDNAYDILNRAGLRHETSMAHDRIEMNPQVMGGKPVIRGTRIPVETVLRKLRAGMTAEAVLADHPRLTRDDILAAQFCFASTQPRML